MGGGGGRGLGEEGGGIDFLTVTSVFVMEGSRNVAGVDEVLRAILVSNGTKSELARPVMKKVAISEKRKKLQFLLVGNLLRAHLRTHGGEFADDYSTTTRRRIF